MSQPKPSWRLVSWWTMQQRSQGRRQVEALEGLSRARLNPCWTIPGGPYSSAASGGAIMRRWKPYEMYSISQPASSLADVLPGGPCSSAPLGGARLRRVKAARWRNGHSTACLRRCFTCCSPPMSSHITARDTYHEHCPALQAIHMAFQKERRAPGMMVKRRLINTLKHTAGA